jgi:predicted nucleic acid-binding protein
VRQYVLDANAVTRYLTKGPGVEKLDYLFAQARRGDAHLSISVINRGEVLYHLARRAGLQEEQADAAAALKFIYKLGYADCFAAELAMRTGATLVTADPEFAKLGKQLKVLALPRHKE